MKTLVVLDFDHTVIDDNSDTWVIKCTPEQALPYGLQNTYEKGKWTEYMGRIFSYIGDLGIKEGAIRSVMETVPYTDGMIELLRFISENKETLDCIIISDANTLFIEWILHAADMHCAIDKIFTNPAYFDDRGYLTVRCFHSHTCTQCPVNLCKRKVLQSFIERQLTDGVKYQRVIYVGDGRNDFCPTNCLKQCDVVMPRKGFALDKIISEVNFKKCEHLNPRVVPWTSGADIIHVINSQ
ncbi:pyridoxal phosphate phosphatase PHOSPHO2 [Erpetoichthys calabaricus]|uniref:pyridoxal phosphate phosphatase PHOSPHO2 n=1 Tax=Erpetoichthys calabaricus TaxID=27687 RepID=UPI0010A09436|nr:pyridoxal phosphate phosphatase PHOSPHO2 [Erpetoichthys calabaricus]XP_051786664.1 pyridoxal phosphate phosphatase PHOSPHO2 [Erpetoichthys calabaricus]